MEVLLVQHGTARARDVDPSRPLTEEGAEDAQQMAVFAARCGVKVFEIRHSGKLRARQTAEIFGETLAPPEGVRETTGLNPDDDVHPVAEALARADGAVMIVGHLPFLARLAGLLLAGDADRHVVRFAHAGIVCLGLEEGGWSLKWAVTPDFVR